MKCYGAIYRCNISQKAFHDCFDLGIVPWKNHVLCVADLGRNSCHHRNNSQHVFYERNQSCKYSQTIIKVVARTCYWASFVAMFFEIFGAKFCFRETCMMLLFRISVQLSVEPIIGFAVCNSQHARAVTSVLLLDYRAYPTWLFR